jgi:hypothetical protein
MTAKGVIRLKVNNEEVNLTTDCTKNTFIELTKEIYARTDIMIQSMYFDECLTDKELKMLTNLK